MVLGLLLEVLVVWAVVEQDNRGQELLVLMVLIILAVVVVVLAMGLMRAGLEVRES